MEQSRRPKQRHVHTGSYYCIGISGDIIPVLLGGLNETFYNLVEKQHLVD